MGLSVATELAGAGHDVTVLEKSIPGAEASSAAAGLLAPQLESKGVGPMLDLCLHSRALYPAWVRRLESLSGVEVGYAESGVLEVAFTAAQLDHACEHTLRPGNTPRGCEVEWLDDARAVEPAVSPSVLGALRFPNDHQVDPPKLMRALPIAAARAGAHFRSGHVRGLIEKNGRACGVDLEGERLTADAVVLAAGSWSSLIAGAHIDARVLRPMRGQMVELRLRLPVSRATSLSSADVYLVPPRKHVPPAGRRVDAGARRLRQAGHRRGPRNGILAAGDSACALHWLPLRVFSTWAGLRPWTEDQLPILGEGPLANLWLATGHFRNGILLAPVTAQVISRLVQGQDAGIQTTHFRYGRFPT